MTYAYFTDLNLDRSFEAFKQKQSSFLRMASTPHYFQQEFYTY
jgi:hypothetical protein